MKCLRLNPDAVKVLLDSMESNDHCTIAYDAQIQELREKIETFAAEGTLLLFRHPSRNDHELTPLDVLPIEVRELVRTFDAMRDDWAEAALPGHKLSARQLELWRDVHEACDRVWNGEHFEWDAPVDGHVHGPGSPPVASDSEGQA